MTGFGRAEYATDFYHAKVEISSVNRKNGEVLIQLPKALQSLEAALRKTILGSVQRGRVQVSIWIEGISQTTDAAVIDEARLHAFMAAVKKVEEVTGQPQKVDLTEIIRIGGIFSLDEKELDPELAQAAIQPAVEEALTELLKMRLVEGEHMQQDVASRIDLLEQETKQITERAPSVIEHYRHALLKRLSESGLELDVSDERVLKEVGIFADRCDISEEIARLDSHFLKFREYLAAKGSVGRSLDFLCQEMNREFNTIGSKANDALLAQHIVNCKTELEKAREQVQNVE